MFCTILIVFGFTYYSITMSKWVITLHDLLSSFHQYNIMYMYTHTYPQVLASGIYQEYDHNMNGGPAALYHEIIV